MIFQLLHLRLLFKHFEMGVNFAGSQERVMFSHLAKERQSDLVDRSCPPVCQYVHNALLSLFVVGENRVDSLGEILDLGSMAGQDS